jgi:hypothetical protein
MARGRPFYRRVMRGVNVIGVDKGVLEHQANLSISGNTPNRLEPYLAGRASENDSSSPMAINERTLRLASCKVQRREDIGLSGGLVDISFRTMVAVARVVKRVEHTTLALLWRTEASSGDQRAQVIGTRFNSRMIWADHTVRLTSKGADSDWLLQDGRMDGCRAACRILVFAPHTRSRSIGMLRFTLTTEPRLHMRSGIGAYGTAFGVPVDTVSRFCFTSSL